eukprot:Plantae.Rhodophyta-Hildenbrandia_rubra.ctg1175.p1 GENE.Plantae.Rhodophyta-Hildenbrandia_rubra.ctg1175~~Plantae.Rhodophyta-Hildenbrandia_rubra.ctg1175.p1  ORF type:complete len:477 (+),score=114.89 Plantae.Rhodophyta-Hildenbrandia_rubra.ctg1175:4935-6365(+)
MSVAHRGPSWLSGSSRRSPSPHEGPRDHRRGPPRRPRRRRRPTLWDVREPLYGIPLPPPGATPPAAVLGGTPRKDGNVKRNVVVMNGLAADEVVGNRGVEGIDVEALKKLLNPRGIGVGNGEVGGVGKVNIGALVGMLGGAGAVGAGVGMRQARRLYVGNLPADATETEVTTFFNDAMIRSGGVDGPGPPIVSVYLNLDKRFAFIELRSLSEAAAALAMDGLLFRGMSLRMRRPNDYDERWGIGVTTPSGFNPSVLGIVSTQVGNGPNKVFIGGIPYHLNEDNIKELLRTYGELRAFNLIKDPNTGQSKGFAFFEYADPAVIEPACAGLNNMVIGDKTLTVRKAGPTGPNSVGGGGGLLAGGGGDATGVNAASLLQQRTKVVLLLNLVSEEELEDEEEMKEVREDVEGEGKTFGKLVECLIPGKGQLGAAKVWLRYEDEEAAEKAVAALNGRKFAGRTVEARYFDEEKFQKRELGD